MKGGDGKVDRKTVEKNRRMQMKNLCFKLANLIPKEFISKDANSQQDHLDRAAAYIHKLRERIERLKQKQELGMMNNNMAERDIDMERDDLGKSGLKLPIVEVRHQEQSLEVLLISGLKKRFSLSEVICILEEEGADVVNASFSIVGNKIIHTIHCQPRVSEFKILYKWGACVWSEYHVHWESCGPWYWVDTAPQYHIQYQQNCPITRLFRLELGWRLRWCLSGCNN